MPPPRAGRRAGESVHRLYVCTTCVRDLPLAPDEPSRGRRLADALVRALAGEGGEDGGGDGLDRGQSQSRSRGRGRGNSGSGGLRLLQVPCLNGCLNPCNVALRASGKYNLRFSRLSPDDAGAVVELARAYAAHPTGDVPEDAWPEALRGKRTVRTPPPHLLLGDPPPAD